MKISVPDHTVFGALLPLVGFLLLSHSATGQPEQIEKSIKALLTADNAKHSFWSVTVRDTTGSPLVTINSKKLIRPASNLKLLTSAAVLDQLGPDFRFSTPVYGNGSLKDSVWYGNIIIRGKGDPTISGRLYGDKPFYVLGQMAKALKQFGIARVNGSIIGNDSYFDRQPFPKGWNWDDLSFYYGVEINALSFNNNCVDLVVNADKQVGEKPAISWFPFNTDFISFQNEQVITPPDTEYEEFYQRLPGSHTIYLGSSLPQNYVETECLSVPDPALFFADTFTKYLERHAGITVSEKARSEHQERNWDGENLTLLYKHRSRKLAEIIEEMNKESDNFYAEMLLKTVAAEQSNQPGSTEEGIKIVKRFAHSMEMDTSLVEMSDASGMSTRTLLSTDDLSLMLHNIRKHPYFPIYKQSLSVSGIDGTLKHRMNNDLLRNKIYGKSGFISGIRTLSGYLSTQKGNTAIFSIAANNYVLKTKKIDSIQEEILKILYRNF